MADQYDMGEHGPLESQPFSLQTTHISAAYHSNDPMYAQYQNRNLKTRSCWKGATTLHDAILPYVATAGFFGPANMRLNNCTGIISALIDRWRPETHTFLMPFGEVTITLEDVSVLFGLPIEGEPICFPTSNVDVNAVCQRLLGDVPPTHKGNQIPIVWLAERFVETDTDFGQRDAIVHQQHARAYIMRLIGGFLFPNSNGDKVDVSYLLLLEDFAYSGGLSWGSALLAHFYREMCNATKFDTKYLNGCSKLLTVWAYERIPAFRPRLTPDRINLSPHLALAHRYNGKGNSISAFVARQILDNMRIPPSEGEWIWQPYGGRSPQPETSIVWEYRMIVCRNQEEVVTAKGKVGQIYPALASRED